MCEAQAGGVKGTVAAALLKLRRALSRARAAVCRACNMLEEERRRCVSREEEREE